MFWQVLEDEENFDVSDFTSLVTDSTDQQTDSNGNYYCILSIIINQIPMVIINLKFALLHIIVVAMMVSAFNCLLSFHLY